MDELLETTTNQELCLEQSIKLLSKHVPEALEDSQLLSTHMSDIDQRLQIPSLANVVNELEAYFDRQDDGIRDAAAAQQLHGKVARCSMLLERYVKIRNKLSDTSTCLLASYCSRQQHQNGVVPIQQQQQQQQQAAEQEPENIQGLNPGLHIGDDAAAIITQGLQQLCRRARREGVAAATLFIRVGKLETKHHLPGAGSDEEAAAAHNLQTAEAAAELSCRAQLQQLQDGWTAVGAANLRKAKRNCKRMRELQPQPDEQAGLEAEGVAPAAKRPAGSQAASSVQPLQILSAAAAASMAAAAAAGATFTAVESAPVPVAPARGRKRPAHDAASSHRQP